MTKDDFSYRVWVISNTYRVIIIFCLRDTIFITVSAEPRVAAIHCCCNQKTIQFLGDSLDPRAGGEISSVER